MAYYCSNFSEDISNVLPSAPAAVAFAVGELVYLDSSGNWQKADQAAYDGSTRKDAQGVIVAVALQYQQVSPVRVAKIRGYSGLTIGAKQYLSATPGAVTETKPDDGAQVAGSAVSATEIFFNIGETQENEADSAISIYGSDGAFKASYSTIDLACAALADEDILKIKAGEYTLTSAIDISALDVQINCEKGVKIYGLEGADYVFKTVFGAISSTKGFTFDGGYIKHRSTQEGIVIENTSATGRINATINNVEFDSSGADSIAVPHAAAGAAIRLRVNDCVLEGQLSFTVKNTDDQCRIKRSELMLGLVTSTDNIAMEVSLRDCLVLHEGVTGGHSSQLLYVMGCFTETDANPNVYCEFDTSDAAGDHTNSLIMPTT